MDSGKTIKVEDNDDECKENEMFIRGTFGIKEEPNHESLQDQRHKNENLNKFDAMKVDRCSTSTLITKATFVINLL